MPEKSRLRYNHGQYWSSVILTAAIGTAIGLCYATIQPRQYEATMSLYFPSADNESFRQLLQAVSKDSATNDTFSFVAASREDEKKLALAREILTSRGAITVAAQESGLTLSSEQIERFRDGSLRIEIRPGSILEIGVTERRSEIARLMCQNLLGYYEQFIREETLTHAGKVRKSLERRYLTMASQLRNLEKKLLGHEDRRRRDLGDSLVVKSDSTRSFLAHRRADDEKINGAILERLRTLRSELKTQRPDELLEQNGWEDSRPRSKDTISQTLGKERVTSDRFSKIETPRTADLLPRVRLERNYEDTTALHRVLLVQHGILRTMEELEELHFRTIDRLSVHPKARAGLLWSYAFQGLIIGLLVGLIVSPRRGRLPNAPQSPH